MILTPYGVPFHPVVVIGLGKNLLFKSVLAHCVPLLIREMKKPKFLNLKFISCMDSNVVLYQSQIWLEPFPKANKSLLSNGIFYEKSNKYCNLEMKKYISCENAGA